MVRYASDLGVIRNGDLLGAVEDRTSNKVVHGYPKKGIDEA